MDSLIEDDSIGSPTIYIPDEKSFNKAHECQEFVCDTCNKSFSQKRSLKQHMNIHMTVRPFACTKCEKTFVLNCHLMIHMNSHADVKLFVCDICDRRYTYKSDLSKHLQVHSGQRFTCEICQKEFLVKWRLKRHLWTHTGEKPFSCEHCPKVFTGLTSLKHHMRRHTGEKPFSCTICQKSFTIKSIFQRHMSVHVTDKKFVCEVCNKRYPSQKTLERHMLAHDPVKRYSCDICQKGFLEKKSFHSHMLMHAKRYRLPCKKCGKGSVTGGNSPLQISNETLMENVTVNMNSMANLPLQQIKPSCHVCKATFDCIGSYYAHVCTHIGIYPYHCAQCGKGFPTIQFFKEHIICDAVSPLNSIQPESNEEEISKTTVNVDPSGLLKIMNQFMCHVCKEMFTTCNRYSEHMCVHVGFYPFYCGTCGNKFVKRGSFIKHWKLHIESERLSCQICRKKFLSTRTLSVHVRRQVCIEVADKITDACSVDSPVASSDHDQAFCDLCGRSCDGKNDSIEKWIAEKYLFCDICEKTFSSSATFNAHMNFHAGLKPHVCQVCQKAYNCSAKLRRHLKKHNSDCVSSSLR